MTFTAVSPAPTRAQRARKLATILVPPLALLLFAGLLAHRMQTMDWGHIGTAIAQVSPAQWVGAGLATVASFLAVGQYDAVLHRVLNTGVSARAARWSGIRAIALSQTLGFGSVTGALVRWRCLPSLDAFGAARVSVAVTLSFMMAWALTTAALVWLTGANLPFGNAVLIGCSVAALGSCAAIVMRDKLPAFAKALPKLESGDIFRLIGWTVVDTGFAALAFALLLPESMMPSFSLIFTAYLVALGAGLLSNAPGGVGAFDLCLLALLPQVPEAPLMASLLAFRVVYYLVPALLALLAIAKAPKSSTNPVFSPLKPIPMGWERTRLLANSPAEWGLARQQAEVLSTDNIDTAWLTARAPKHLVMFGAPRLQNQLQMASFRDIQLSATALDLHPALYSAPPPNSPYRPAIRAGTVCALPVIVH